MRPLVTALLVLFLAAGCSGERGRGLAGNVAVFLGIARPPDRPTSTTDVIIDRSAQSPSTIEAASATLAASVADASTRPSPSCVRLWTGGATVSDARLLGESCVPNGTPPRNAAAAAAAAAGWRERAHAQLVHAADGAFRGDPPRHSPLAETLTRVALARRATAEWKIYYLTDGREESDLGRFECLTLPAPAEWERTLHDALVLEPTTLSGADVAFVYFGFSDAKRPGCATTVKREAQIRDLWRVVLTRASARSVQFHPGAPAAGGEGVQR